MSGPRTSTTCRCRGGPVGGTSYRGARWVATVSPMSRTQRTSVACSCKSPTTSLLLSSRTWYGSANTFLCWGLGFLSNVIGPHTWKLNQLVKTFVKTFNMCLMLQRGFFLLSSVLKNKSSQQHCMNFQINLMLFIFLLGAVEIVPLFLGHITGKQYPIMSHLQPPINGGGGAAGDTEGSPSGQGAEPGSVEGSTARMSEIERLKEVNHIYISLFHSFIRYDCDFSSRGRCSPMRHLKRCRFHRPLSLRIPPKSRVSRGTPPSTTSWEHCRLQWLPLETFYW